MPHHWVEVSIPSYENPTTEVFDGYFCMDPRSYQYSLLHVKGEQTGIKRLSAADRGGWHHPHTRVPEPSDSQSSVRRFQSHGSRPFWRRKLTAAPICQRLSGQISLFFTGSQKDGWSHFIKAARGHGVGAAPQAALTAWPPSSLLPSEESDHQQQLQQQQHRCAAHFIYLITVYTHQY